MLRVAPLPDLHPIDNPPCQNALCHRIPFHPSIHSAGLPYATPSSPMPIIMPTPNPTSRSTNPHTSSRVSTSSHRSDQIHRPPYAKSRSRNIARSPRQSSRFPRRKGCANRILNKTKDLAALHSSLPTLDLCAAYSYCMK
ncbi:hypothetical protein K491DRAFT_149618 [Lophiostoma macrostomum CBS 122681]|uniref:Uncharacterized protein n=1 Tax=Lophiostoma macrostomum CBS 122681 TaxID=1314788 RepID=A0A6A6TLZ3_9PLEO|nr:hypothetical protein K491DRAFT_149618 [Lophiostoma macrostomum CBS 122681]